MFQGSPQAFVDIRSQGHTRFLHPATPPSSWRGFARVPARTIRLAVRCGKAELWLSVGFQLFNTLFQNFARISSDFLLNFTRVSNLSTLTKGITTTQPSHTVRSFFPSQPRDRRSSLNSRHEIRLLFRVSLSLSLLLHYHYLYYHYHLYIIIIIIISSSSSIHIISISSSTVLVLVGAPDAGLLPRASLMRYRT